MDTSLYSQWMQPQQQQSHPLLAESSQQHESRPVESAGPSSPTAATPTLDMSDFTTLGDIGAPTPSTSSLQTASSSFYPFQHNFYVTSPYNAMAYGSSWTPQLPLSNYSSLNGATTSSAASSSQQPSSQSQSQSQPQPQSSQPQPMVIDPALTTINGSGSNSTHHYSTSNYSPPSSQSQQPQRPQYQFQTYLHPTLSLSTSYLHPSHFQQPSISQPQGTLSPQALHTPSSSIMGSLMPTTFYTQPSTSASSSTSGSSTPTPMLTPQERRQQFQNSIKPLLISSAFTGAQAVATLVDRIDEFGSQDVEAATRLEILTKIRDGAGNHYFRAWAENVTAMDITREWLKAAFTAKADSILVETIMPLLHIIDRLPLNVESLKASKLGKLIVKLVKEPPSSAIKDMASNVERRWRQLVSAAEGGSKAPESNKTEESKAKKRKLSEPPPPKIAPPPKKPALGSGSTSKPVVKKEVKPVVTAVKDAKSDSSFFSAPKPKPKLPTFKKAPPAPTLVKKEPDPNVAQPSSIDPFQEALKSMGKVRRDSPMVSTPPAAPVVETPPPTTGLTKNGKKKKSVSWAPDGQLESIRLIEKAVYDDDPVDGTHVLHNNLRELDRGEGAALHAHLFEETVDWSEPLLIEVPPEIDLRPRGELSEEKNTQEQREQTALSAVYMSPAHIPDTPAEPSSILPEEEVDKDVKVMTSGPEVDTVFWSSPAPTSSVADLVGQLAAGGGLGSTPSAATTPSGGLGPSVDLKSFGIDPSYGPAIATTPELQQLLQHLNAVGAFPPPAAPQQPPYGSVDQSWNAASQYTEFGHGYHDEGGARDHWSSGDRGRSGRGRGRGRGRGDDSGGYKHTKRKPCSFFAAGRCKYGDQCDFAHDAIY